MRILITKICIILGVSFSITDVCSQNIVGDFKYRAGDELRKQAVEYSLNIEDTTSNVVWDLDNMKELTGKRRVRFREVKGQAPLIFGVEGNTRFYYESKNDSLLVWGFENNLEKEVYDIPSVQLHTPLKLGDRINGIFHGRKICCERFFSRVFGTWSVEVDGMGIMLLPQGDTLQNVIRVHYTEKKAQQQYSNISTEKELIAYLDSLPQFNGDSITAFMKDSVLMTRDVYRLYSVGYRYPIFETIITRGNEVKQVESFYLSPDIQEIFEDISNEEIRCLLSQIKNKKSRAENTSPMSRCDLTMNGNNLLVSFDLSERADVECMISDPLGLVLFKKYGHFEAGNGNELVLDCSSLRSGTYVLYMNVNGIVDSHTVRK